MMPDTAVAFFAAVHTRRATLLARNVTPAPAEIPDARYRCRSLLSPLPFHADDYDAETPMSLISRSHASAAITTLSDIIFHFAPCLLTPTL